MFLGVAHISDFNFLAISTFVCHFLSVFMLSKRYHQNKVMSVSMRHFQYCFFFPSSCLFDSVFHPNNHYNDFQMDIGCKVTSHYIMFTLWEVASVHCRCEGGTPAWGVWPGPQHRGAGPFPRGAPRQSRTQSRLPSRCRSFHTSCREVARARCQGRVEVWWIW